MVLERPWSPPVHPFVPAKMAEFVTTSNEVRWRVRYGDLQVARFRGAVLPSSQCLGASPAGRNRVLLPPPAWPNECAPARSHEHHGLRGANETRLGKRCDGASGSGLGGERKESSLACSDAPDQVGWVWPRKRAFVFVFGFPKFFANLGDPQSWPRYLNTKPSKCICFQSPVQRISKGMWIRKIMENLNEVPRPIFSPFVFFQADFRCTQRVQNHPAALSFQKTFSGSGPRCYLGVLVAGHPFHDSSKSRFRAWWGLAIYCPPLLVFSRGVLLPPFCVENAMLFNVFHAQFAGP